MDLKLGKKYWTPNGKSRVDSQLGTKKVGPQLRVEFGHATGDKKWLDPNCESRVDSQLGLERAAPQLRVDGGIATGKKGRVLVANLGW